MSQWSLPVDNSWVMRNIRNRLFLAIGLYLLVLGGIVLTIRAYAPFDHRTWFAVSVVALFSLLIIKARLALSEFNIKKTWDIIIVKGMLVCGFGKKVLTMEFSEAAPLTVSQDSEKKYWLLTAKSDNKAAKLPVSAYPDFAEFIDAVSGKIGHGYIELEFLA